MRLLIFTQKLDKNDQGVLGFFHGWVEEFAKHCEKVAVICLYRGEYSLPENVEVLSLGKEGGRSRIKYLYRFFKYIWQKRNDYDFVFVHMNEIYILLGGIFWKLWRKRIGLWYAHGEVNLFLRMAEKIADIIFTSTKSGFRIESQKVKVVGQGVNTEIFKLDYSKKDEGIFEIVTVGRISPTKDYETLISACEVLNKQGVNFRTNIIGEAAMESDKEYKEDLKHMILEKKLENKIKFLGGIVNQKIAGHLQSADLFVNMSHTGSLDKVMLEAMACGLPVLTCNEAMLEVLGDYKDRLMYRKRDFERLAQQMAEIYGLSTQERKTIGLALCQIVSRRHNMEDLIKKIISGIIDAKNL